MELIVIKNSELAEPYCYEYWDSERNTWVGVLEKNPPKQGLKLSLRIQVGQLLKQF